MAFSPFWEIDSLAREIKNLLDVIYSFKGRQDEIFKKYFRKISLDYNIGREKFFGLSINSSINFHKVNTPTSPPNHETYVLCWNFPLAS